MHQCLWVEEILCNVTFYLGVRPKDLVNMASTCHAFYEPPMDALWHTLDPGVLPLVRLLPSHVLIVRQDEMYQGYRRLVCF